jgi:hypothetical protein
MAKFKVSDVVVGNHPDKYYITTKGWKGEVTKVCEHSNEMRVRPIKKDEIHGFSEWQVDISYFDLFQRTNSESDELLQTSDYQIFN